jgi:uncharacterized protein YigA (DUF484 family)
MKVIIALLILAFFVTAAVTVDESIYSLEEITHKNDSIQAKLRQTEESLLQCSDCCNQMNIRMSEWYVRKDSIIYDYYVRSINKKL